MLLYMGNKSAGIEQLVLDLYDYNGPIAVDIETISIENDTPIGIGFAINPDEAYYFTIDDFRIPWNKIKDPRITKIFHNVKFDYKGLKRAGHPVPVNFQDSMIGALSLGLPGKLSMISSLYGGKENVEITDLIGKGKSQITMDQVPIEDVGKKCAIDCQNTFKVWSSLVNKGLPEAYDLDMEVLPILFEMEGRGVKVDIDKLKEYTEKTQREVTYFKKLGQGLGFNPGSSEQGAYVLRSRGWPIYFNKKTGKPKLDEIMLRTVYWEDPVAHLIYQYRRANVLLTTFLKALEKKHLKGGDRLHVKFNVAGAASGRISTSPNSQNIPSKIRDIYIPSVGNEFVVWDLSQIEYRTLAWLCQDPKLLEVYASGGDMHSATMEALGITDRVRAKGVNYSILFGGDARTLYTRSQIPYEIGQQYIDGMLGHYTVMSNYIRSLQQQILEDGKIRTVGGRVREFPDVFGGMDYKIQAALREGVNHVIQGTAAEIQKRIILWARKENQWNTVHDESDFDVPIGYRPAVPPEIGVLASFKTPIDIGVGKNWQEAKG